ncbi:MAG: TIGR03986 family CRISPR-associated RAMP protein [Acidobacteriota bacterium]|nr:TIGR03986 family CRISPR-associated RAMP protein [Acidobacteriota bacterium]
MATGNNKRFSHSNPTRNNRTARAPYNFVPLPDQLITVAQEQLPPLDSYAPDTFTGWFECELETRSATYVRGLMTREQHEKSAPKAERKLTDAEQENLKLERAGFYSNDPAQEPGVRTVPAIPGSTLRGMIRGLIEIAGYGKMRWVNDLVKVTFRAVAASREDPLAEPYRDVIGQFSRNVLAGYLRQQANGDWAIQPALKPKQKGWTEQAAYLKVKEAKIPSEAITDFYRFDDWDYWPEHFQVSFNAVNERGKRGTFVRITQIGDADYGYQHRGVLVCTGSMIEGGKDNQRSPRRNHALVLEADERAKSLPISREMLDAYRESLTPFQRDELWAEGGLENGAPVFYVTAKDGSVLWFGHTPNFRIPARNEKGELAAVRDFIPPSLRQPNEDKQATEPDLAEAIFGWIDEKADGNPTKLVEIETENGKKQKLEFTARAGRVSFSDAQYVSEKNGVWYSAKAIKPAPLSGPKITTFQHYLTQDKTAGHDPDLRGSLAHYSTDAEIRGHKLYWHKGDAKIPLADAKTKESQLTRIDPVKAGVKFRFRVHFENLRDYELGALAWALTLPDEGGKNYCHKLGMGKPLGMGAVKLTPRLYLTNRQQRYAALFAGAALADGATAAEPGKYLEAFERFVWNGLSADEKKDTQRLAETQRIRMLLAMLEWREWNAQWADRTRYLLIEHPQFGNEYKDRPVLPDPLAVIGEKTTAPQANPLFTKEQTGSVVELPPSRSFGYIQYQDSHGNEQRLFFHFSQLARGVKVQLNQRVRFKVREGQRGPEAYDVRPAE